MKLITAFVRPIMLDKIAVALENIKDFPGITVTNAEGFGQRLRTSSYDALNPFKEKKRIEIVCEDGLAEEIVLAIREHAHTGKKGDGIIFVVPVEKSSII
jgi:nitrogen regulatory protein PII